MGRTTVLITLHGSKHQVLGASARRPILVYQAANFEEVLRRIHHLGTPVNKGEGYLAAVRQPDGIFPILDDQLSISAVGSYREVEDARPLGTGILVEDYPVMQGDHSGEYSLPL